MSDSPTRTKNGSNAHQPPAEGEPDEGTPVAGQDRSPAHENTLNHSRKHDHHAAHGHDHHDHHDHDSDGGEDDLTDAIEAARLGLRSEVQKLVEVLPEAEVYIPLSEDLPDTEEGEVVEWEGELTFRPHMILGEDQSIFAVCYSDPDLVEHMAEALGWQTSGEELKLICVPAQVAFDLAQLTIDGERVSGLVFNPGTDVELVLQRDEAASLLLGTAIPLVGYVADLPADVEEQSQVVEGADPPPDALLEALSKAKANIADLVDVRVETTFNPERDREPHLTIFLTIIARHDLDRQALADEVMEDAAPHLPAPGYADIVFLDAPN